MRVIDGQEHREETADKVIRKNPAFGPGAAMALDGNRKIKRATARHVQGTKIPP
jgi:hypothetical protein